MIKNEKKYILYAFLLNLAMGVVFVATGFIIGKGTFYLGTDYNYQQILFGQMARDNILAGNFLWMDNFELGSSLIGALSFYGVGSPFFWLTLLFPNVSYPIIAPCMLALKLAVAGTGTYCYIRQYTKECKWALVASMLYAFSGYQIFNINFHFQDALAFFPFLLLALDINVKKDKKGWFAVTVALMAFTKYFFLAQIIVFLVIYFVVKLWTKEYSLNTKLFVQLAIESILGVSSAMVLLLPTVLIMAGNPR